LQHSYQYYTVDNIQNNIDEDFNNNSVQCWTLDSGASYHMTNDVNILTNVKRIHRLIYFATGEYVIAKSIGQYIGYVNNTKIKLNNVLYIPEFKRNLISIDQLINKNYKIIFYKCNNKNCVTLYNKVKNKICTIFSNDSKTYKLYTTLKNLNFNKKSIVCYNLENASNNNLELWHRRLGHFNIDLIKEKLKDIPIKQKCPICSRAKLKNFQYPRSENKTKGTFELIHMDLVSSSEPSIYGNKYFLSILDDYSRYGWVIFLKSKADTFDAFIIWYKRIKNIFDKTIKYIKTDNGLEFANSKFREFLNNEGIVHQLTVPYNPQQNGRVERLNGTVISNASAMLEDAKLSRRFWEDAVSTANYIHNNIPHKGNNNKVPFEVLFDKKVNYNKFKVFGCKCFYYVPKQFRKKFYNSTLPGIFIGYDNLNPTAYKIYDYNNNKVILSHAVQFFEDIPGNVGNPNTIPDNVNFTIFSEDNNNDDIQEIFKDFNYNNQSDLNNNINLNNILTKII